jgi:hypothetical protein
MAFGTPSNVADAAVTGGGLQATPQNYISLATLIDPTKPDVRDLYVQTYGDQGITGFLELTGAKKNAGTSDKVEWYEEGRLHKTVVGQYDEGDDKIYLHASDVEGGAPTARVNDVLLSPAGHRLLVTAVSTDGDGATTTERTALTVTDLGKTDSSADEGTPGTTGTFGTVTFAIIGNMHAQGTEQPTAFYQTGLIKRSNPYIIVKEMYEVSGSQATNIGWLNVNGQYMWYLKNEMDARKRFMNEREMMLLYSEANDGNAVTVGSDKIVPSEGYFEAVEKRGITVAGSPAGFDGDFDNIILELDKEGAPNEYAMYLNRAQSLKIDDLLARGPVAGGNSITAGLASQFGAFNNSQDLAVSLGFKSFTRGGYTFHKHDWKLLNDPTLGGIGGPTGAMIPMSQVADANTGVKSPALEMNYKAAGNYSREMEHWVEGGGVLGHVTSGKDTVKFNYRSECNLVTRAANQHVLLQG